MGDSAYCLGENRPMWSLFAVPDIFADAFLDPDARRQERPAPPFHCLAQSLQVVQEGLNRLLRDRALDSSPDSLRAVVGLQRAMVESLQLGARLPIGKMDDDDDNAEQKLAAKYLDFLNTLVMKVNSIRPGELLMCPGGWRTSEKEGHAVVYLVFRAQNTFTFAMCNTGSGLDYHPAKSEIAPPKLKRALTMVFENIPLPRLSDSSFWFMLFRPMVYPDPSNGPSYLYEVLLPYLNGRPLSSNAVRQDQDGPQEPWRPPPVAASAPSAFDNPFGNVPLEVVPPQSYDFGQPAMSPSAASVQKQQQSSSAFADPFGPSSGLEQFAAMAANPTLTKPATSPPQQQQQQQQQAPFAASTAAAAKPVSPPAAAPAPPAGKPVTLPQPAGAGKPVAMAPPPPPPPAAAAAAAQTVKPPAASAGGFESFDLSALSAPVSGPSSISTGALPASNPNAALFAGLESGTRLEFGKKPTAGASAPAAAAKKPVPVVLPPPSLPPNKPGAVVAPPPPASVPAPMPAKPAAPKTKSEEDLVEWDDFEVAADPFASLQEPPKGPRGAVGPDEDEDGVICEFRTPPRGGDASYARCLLEAVHAGVRLMGATLEQAKSVSLLLRFALVKMMQSDLITVTKAKIGFADRLLVDRAGRNLAHAAAKQARLPPSSPGVCTTAQLFDIKRAVNDLRARLVQLEPVADFDLLPPELDLGSLPANATTHPLFGRFRVDYPSVEPLAGEAARPPIYRPVQLTLVPDHVESFHDVGVALRHCANLCTRLAHQQGMIKNTYLLRVALIQHLFTRVIPVPLSLDHPRRLAQCFWGATGRDMRRETQVDILRLLDLVAQHFAAAALSLRATRSLDAVRILTMACIAAVSDAVMRKAATDVPSPLSALYAGEGMGPAKAFGIEMRQFAAESAYFTLTDPNLALVRTQVLDYFMRQRQLLDDDHVLFRWEQSMNCGPAEELLIDELCLQVGYPRPADAYGAVLLGASTGEVAAERTRSARTLQLQMAARYLSGELPEILQDFPELGHFRDVVMVLKVMMAPTADALPDARAWSPGDAILTWQSVFVKPDDEKVASAALGDDDEEDLTNADPKAKKAAAAKKKAKPKLPSAGGPAFPMKKTVAEWLAKKPATARFVVKGFRDTELKPTWAEVQGQGTAWFGGLLNSIKSLFLTKKVPRVAPSMANPAFLLGAPCATEEDALHVKQMPDFGGRLSARNVELLAQYLTVPYLRIPLVLKFFATQEMTSALSCPELMEMVDGVVFEPGEWQATEAKTVPTVVPAPDRDHLATPLGLLFNELRYAPDALLDAIERMVFNVLELDTGRYSKHSSPAALYVTRLCLRVYGYAMTLLHHAEWVAKSDSITTMSGGGTHVRGLECPEALSSRLEQVTTRWRSMLLGRVLPMLTGWLRRCDEAGDMDIVCVLRAHLAYLFKETDWTRDTAGESSESVITSVAGLAARTLLTSQIFITASYRVVTEPRPASRFENPEAAKARQMSDADVQKLQARLGLDELEMFALFQRHRVGLLKWLKAHPETTNELMEHAVAVLVNDAERRRRQMLDRGLGDLEEVAKPTTAYEARTWSSMTGVDCDGRFVPDTEAAEARKRKESRKEPTDFEAWLREGADQDVDTELNVQLGEFTLKKHRVEPVNDVMCDFADFADIFGDRVARTGGVHSAEVKHTTMRSWVRLVGQRHDLQLWALDPRAPASPFNRLYPAKLSSHERWIYDAIDPILKLVDNSRIEVYLEPSTAPEAEVTRLAVKLQSPTPVDGLVLESIKEIVVVRRGVKPEVQIYDVVETGRKFYSSLVFTTDNSTCLQQCISGDEHVAAQFLTRAVLPSPSLVITRNLSSALGVQQYLPDRFLYGRIPEALVEEYVFWQNQSDGSIVGYQRQQFSKGGSSKPLYQLRLLLEPDGPTDATGAGGAHANMVAVRHPLLHSSRVKSALEAMEDEAPLLGVGAADQIDSEGNRLVLINLATTGSKGPVRRLCDLLSRLDCMSHIVAWAREDDKEAGLDLVELPRLGLNFRVERRSIAGQSAQQRRLHCLDHPGLFVSNEGRKCRRTQALLKGIPHGLVLERDSDGALFVLLPASAKPVCKRHSGPGGFDSFELLLERSDSTWIANLKDPKSTNNLHYLYPVHASRSFMFTPTFASALYLLLLRLIAGRYDEAFRLVDFCVTDTTLTPEERQLVEQVVESQEYATHVDAVACRLKMILVTAGTPMAASLPWRLARELQRYLTSLTHVSGGCRLSREEEMLLLELESASSMPDVSEEDDRRVGFEGASALLINRMTFLHKLQNQFLQAPNEPFYVNVISSDVSREVAYDFDAINDATVATVDDEFLKKMAVINYTKPKDEVLTGVQAALNVLRWTKPGRLRLRGGSDNLGFLFMYELMTDMVMLKVLPGDSPFNWGAMFLRHLPREDTETADVLSSMLRAMAKNPNLAGALPKFDDQRRFKISTIFRGQNVLQRLIVEFRDFCSRHPEAVQAPRPFRKYEAPLQVKAQPPAVALGLMGGDRTLFAPRVPDNARSLSELNPVAVAGLKVTREDLLAFCRVPMSGGINLNEFVHVSSKRSRGEPLYPDKVPFDVSKHPSSKTHVAKTILSRLQEDVEWYAESNASEETPRLLGFSKDELLSGGVEHAKTRLDSLRQSLQALRDRDDRFVSSGIDALLRLVNQVDTNEPSPTASEEAKHAFRRRLALLFARDHGQEPTMWLTLLVGTALSSKGFGELKRVNPFLTDDDIGRISDLVTALMLTINRASLVARCRVAAASLTDLLDRLAQAPVEAGHLLNETALRALQLAELLATRRHYMQVALEQGSISYDPRLLVFEFMQDIVLRKPQVQLVEEFKGALASGESRCHQMLMGGGKTTVVAPILALLLGAKEQLVVQVVPHALFDFSVTVMRACFSAVLQKHVYTFSYDRFTTPSTALLQKLLKAKASRGLVVTTPTSLKSFSLKFVETCNAIVELRAAIASGTADLSKLSFVALLGRRFTRRREQALANEQARVNKQALEALTHQAELCVRMLALFREGTLLLDEVDLILHPLKSELNWPLGSKAPLDFSEGGSKRGLRWRVPFHLMDAIFCATDPRLSVEHEASREAQAVLRKLRKVVDDGCEQKHLQRTPHLVLVSRPFYDHHILPLLAKWSLVMLTGFGLSGITNEQLLLYLERGTFASKEQHDQVMRSLNDEQVKLVNLTHDWLHAFMPHILAKVDRVHFGLLNKDDLARALKLEPNMPKSRKLLAVPFVGKDVPSRSSEFAHPDVVIGFAICAYRYEGLREHDFMQVLEELKERMSSESGAYEKRSSCILYERWIKLAGGRVRGRGAIVAQAAREEDLMFDVTKDDEARRSKEAEFVKRAVYLEGLRTDEELFQDIWPLQFIDLRDEEQTGVLFRLLRKLPHVVEFFLDEFIFPVTTPHQGLKLSTCGQALGGELLFKQRLGFSGTPSDILPVELGQCHYEKGSDAQMMFLLGSPAVVSHEVLDGGWSVRSILERVAAGPYHALLDTGALITGMSNLEVATALLRYGLKGHEGVVFLDEGDRKMILLRAGMRVVELSQCGLLPHQRFSFYDQIHTTGMDIHQALNAKAVLTLGKDMVFRDYAQGAFRMRGIGKGQTIHLFIIPEVLRVAEDQLRRAGEPCAEEVSAVSRRLQPGFDRDDTQDERALLRAVCAWLIINTMKSERLQFNLLCEQSVQNVWRKRAYWTLLRTFADGQTRVELQQQFRLMEEETAGDKPLPLDASVEVFRERVDYTLANTVPQKVPLAEKIANMIHMHEQFLVGPTDAMRVSAIQRLVADRVDTDKEEGAAAPIGRELQEDMEGAVFERENVQENEQEQETEQEQEQEQEQEAEKEAELEHETFSGLKYARDDYLEPWPFASLANPKANIFFPASDFTVYGAGRIRPKPLSFPSFMLLSPNYYKPSWSNTSQHRRLKNVIMIMEWIPDLAKLGEELDEVALAARQAEQAAKLIASGKVSAQQLSKMSQQSSLMVLTADQERILRHAFDLYGTDALNHKQLREVLATMGMDIESDDEIAEALAAAGRPGSLFADFDLVKKVVLMRPLEKVEEGRFFVVVNLAEAETLRGILHAKADVFDDRVSFRDLVDNANTTLALRVADFSIKSSSGGGQLSPLEQSGKFRNAKRFQALTAAQVLRFIDSEMFYQERELNCLIGALKLDPCEDRRKWFTEVRSCRRRTQHAIIDSTPVARVFTEPDQYRMLAHRATIARVRGLIATKRMFLLDAFRAFDTDRDGRVGCSELISGFDFLGMRLTPLQVQDFMREVSPSGYLTYEEFKGVFADRALRDADPLLGGSGAMPISVEVSREDLEDDDQVLFADVVVEPRRIEELGEIGVDAPKEEDQARIVKVLQGVSFTVNPHTTYSLVWSTRVFKNSAFKCSVWSPDLALSWFARRSRELICLGHLGVEGSGEKTDKGGFVLQMYGATRHPKIKDRLLPTPVRFTNVWSKTQGTGDKPLFVFLPVPPSDDFVSLGMVASTSQKEPALDSVRCVPKSWCVKSAQEPVLVWADTGTAGRAGALWSVTSLGLLWATVGHEPPKGPFWELKSPSWLVNAEYQMVTASEKQVEKVGGAVEDPAAKTA